MAKLDRGAARLLFAVLLLVAAVGFANSLAAALRAPRTEIVSAGVDPARDPVPNAAASAAPPMDEARVRAIAREEAAGALAARRPAPAKPKAADEDAGTDDEAGAAAKSPVITPTAPPPTLTPELPAPRLTPG